MNTSVNVVNKGRVRLYACGGAGINIGHALEQYRGSKETGFAELDIVYIDTSKSNLRTGIKDDHCYMLDGMDGSGKVRSENHEEISSRIRAILQQFKPADLNIVLSSAAGGSGSVIAPLLASELLGGGLATIVMSIGSSDTRLDTENTLKTIKSYESIARLRKAPVVMTYVENSQSNSRPQSDKTIISNIMALCILFSRENHELDARDLFNWLRFDRVTTFPVQLASLTLIEGGEPIKDLGNIISVATVAKTGDDTVLDDKPDYQCVGYLSEHVNEAVFAKAPMHFITSDGIFLEVANRLQKILKDMEQVKDARIRNKDILMNTDTPVESGLVL